MPSRCSARINNRDSDAESQHAKNTQPVSPGHHRVHPTGHDYVGAGQYYVEGFYDGFY